MGGPAKTPILLKDHNIPNRMPYSLVGLTAPQVAPTDEIQNPLKYPYRIKPIITTGTGSFVGTQNARSETNIPQAAKTYMFHTPNLSDRKPDVNRPTAPPACRMAIE